MDNIDRLKIGKDLNVLTIDVEDYYQVSGFESVIRFEHWDRYESRVERNTYRILDILNEHKTKATFFILGWVAERFPGLVRRLHAEGHEIGSHSYAHKLIYRQTPAEFREDLKRSKGMLEDIISDRIIGYRAPSYSITKASLWAFDFLIEEGFLYDSSVFPIRRDRYGIPDAQRFPYRVSGTNGGSILEIPLSTVVILGTNIPVAGGGYLRLFPYSFIRWGLKHINEAEGRGAVIYIHPWEIDTHQPRLRGSLLSMFRHYISLDRTEPVLKKMLEEFQLHPMRRLYDQFTVSRQAQPTA